MKITTKTYPSGKTVTMLEPDEGFKYITNNSVWSDKVILGKSDSIENWHDTNEEPPKPEEPKPEEPDDTIEPPQE